MDAAIILVLTFVALVAWLVAIADETTPALYRVLGIFPGVEFLAWYALKVIGETNSPRWNDIQGGPIAMVCIGLGFIAFLSRAKPPKDETPAGGLPA